MEKSETLLGIVFQGSDQFKPINLKKAALRLFFGFG